MIIVSFPLIPFIGHSLPALFVPLLIGDQVIVIIFPTFDDRDQQIDVTPSVLKSSGPLDLPGTNGIHYRTSDYITISQRTDK